MKILIGLIYYLENEYDDCISSIKEQTYTDWDIFEVRKLPKKEAHHKLYSTFMKSSSDYDIFLKLDADMVLARSTFFEEIISETKKNPSVNHFEIKVLDKFTDSLIHGLHIYRNSVKWELGEEVYFTDRTNSTTNYKGYLKKSDPLVPATIHSPNPSYFQAFHFGIHKMVKVLQVGVSKPNLNASAVQLRNIYLTNKNYYKSSNLLLAHSVLGAFWALDNKADYTYANYESEEAKLASDFYKEMTKEEIERRVFRINAFYLMKFPLKIWTILMLFRVHKLKKSTQWFCSGLITKIGRCFGRI